MITLQSGLAGAAALAVLMISSQPAKAASLPQVGPVPSWVAEPPATAAAAPQASGLPVAVLLNDVQLSFDADGWTEYHEFEAKVQAAEGLQALGAIPFQWSPSSDTLTFHRARILRDGQSLDVLPKDGGFTVLRRETGLEQATLTGELTALIQPEGLQVGDVLEIAVSIRHADPLLKQRPAALFANWDLTPVGRLRLQARWPRSLPMRWRESDGLPPLRQTQAAGEAVASLDMSNLSPLILPAHAPLRFQHGRQVEFSTFADWREVSERVAPLFEKAAVLAPQSPVAAEAARIAARSTDSKARAAAALQLVQTQIRYLAHAEASAGYTPQTPDETWRLRYGDCKAKSVLLLVLLRQMGLTAEPVLASTVAGDGLDSHLPSAQLFNHVLVHMRLAGRDYWLDGTRQGDRDLDEIETPAFGWVLSLGPGDGRLVHLNPAPATRPQMLQVIRYDASAGVTAPEPTKLETTFRGDAAVLIHNQLSAVPAAQMDAALRTYWAGVHTAFTPTHVAADWDAARGEETLTAEGTSKLDWSGSGLELEHVSLGGAPDIKRDPAAVDPDAPYLVGFPGFVETDESVVLPPDDKPAAGSVKVADVDQTIAGVAYRRNGSLDGRVFRVVASQRALKPEISAAEARASVDPLTKLGNESVYAPAGPAKQAADDAANINSEPTTVSGHIDRGGALLSTQKYPEALKEFDAAIAMDAKAALAWVGRATAHAWLGEAAALADADKAQELGAPPLVTFYTQGVLAEKNGDLNVARRAYERCLALSPNDGSLVLRLVTVEVRNFDFSSARSALTRFLKTHPQMEAGSQGIRSWIEIKAGNKKEAETDLGLIQVLTPEDHMKRAEAYMQLNDKDFARADIDTALHMQPSAGKWVKRAFTDGGYRSAAAQADIQSASNIAPKDLDVEYWQINTAASIYDYQSNIRLINQALIDHPEATGNLLIGRAQAYNHLGRLAEMNADLTRARELRGPQEAYVDTLCNVEVVTKWRNDLALEDCQRALREQPDALVIRADRAILFHRLGRPDQDDDLALVRRWTHDPKALTYVCSNLSSENFQLDLALLECDAALKLQPSDAEILDSRAFTLMRLGREEEALATYDRALLADSKTYSSLYGRGLVEAGLGRSELSAHDIAQALAADPTVKSDFAKMGVTQ